MTETIRPPDDAPWVLDHGQRHIMRDNRIVAECYHVPLSMQLVAAANALPGLAELIAELLAWDESSEINVLETELSVYDSIVGRMRAALAALPKEVRP